MNRHDSRGLAANHQEIDRIGAIDPNSLVVTIETWSEKKCLVLLRRRDS